MIIVDTNALSALMRIEREPAVARWLDGERAEHLRVSAPSLFEVHYGISSLPAGRKRRELAARLADVLADVFRNSVLPLDLASSAEAGRIHALQVARGRNVEVPDSQIAGIARTMGASVATRNIDDFTGLGIGIINPWDGTGL
jgi:predicted nucleic acid-binding protein